MSLTSSQQVSFWEVHTFVTPLLELAGSWPVAGTPEWVDLPEDDPRKQAALYDAARHHILRVETAQEALCDAAKAISAAEDWSTVARVIYNRTQFESTRPWLKRGAA